MNKQDKLKLLEIKTLINGWEDYFLISKNETAQVHKIINKLLESKNTNDKQ